MLEGRSAQFVEELVLHGTPRKQAEAEVSAAIDRWVYYAGWCDKYQAVFNSVNPTNTSHFNFSVYEPTGVVGVMSRPTVVCWPLVDLDGSGDRRRQQPRGGGRRRASPCRPSPSPRFWHERPARWRGEPDHRPAQRTAEALVAHMDVNALVVAAATPEERTMLDAEATCNVKRVVYRDLCSAGEGPYAILDTQEVKTTWHPASSGGRGGWRVLTSVIVQAWIFWMSRPWHGRFSFTIAPARQRPGTQDATEFGRLQGGAAHPAHHLSATSGCGPETLPPGVAQLQRSHRGERDRTPTGTRERSPA